MVRNLAKDTVQAAKTQVPDARQQVQRIKAARAYAETLTKPESHDTDKKTHTPTVNLDELGFTWYCDGRTADGVGCNNGAGFENELYHCVYCSACDFCRDCLD
ncbi:uncharacterized protein P174DRAFT_420819 [Aspergillus novofumigatus IBT 16806]|uniref:Uncharacterized protein n=1 Tax=Aspergillus novofumigatus (strain IBT 16806) TaxID=1392255 RepID=A0A2I1C9J0_ASPN1|nr:uncharacterized protein P174DRAFT_420819 [Aspergillus novofumigatus IBT 16806]PKX94265.1 hypothetical protein P174DRAFT_420819 [Aspergillus novofumigatus IBT 16806]